MDAEHDSRCDKAFEILRPICAYANISEHDPRAARVFELMAGYIAYKLRGLAVEMQKVAGLMTEIPEYEHWCRHGIELEGAARMARDWADGLDREGRGEDAP